MDWKGSSGEISETELVAEVGGSGQGLAEFRVRGERDLGAVTLCEGY